MRKIQYIVLHHSATDYRATIRIQTEQSLQRQFAKDKAALGLRNFQTTSAIITL